MSERILVVDDDADIRFLLRTMFRRAGFEVEEATNGKEAVERARAEDFDAVLLDVVMPVMDGNEACRRLRDDPKTSTCAIIMMTGKAISEAGAEMVDCADDWLRKPFDLNELADVVRGAMDHRRGDS